MFTRIIFLSAVALSLFYLFNKPFQGEVNLAYQENFKWDSKAIIKHDRAYINDSLDKIDEFKRNIEAKLLSIESKLIQSRSLLEKKKNSLSDIKLEKNSLLDQFETLSLSKGDVNLLKDLQYSIIELDDKQNIIQDSILVLNEKINNRVFLRDKSRLELNEIEKGKAELELLSERLTLHGDSMFNGANKKDIVKILANAEALSNHLDRNSLDMNIDKRNVTRDMDQRFAEILKKAKLENNS